MNLPVTVASLLDCFEVNQNISAQGHVTLAEAVPLQWFGKPLEKQVGLVEIE